MLEYGQTAARTAQYTTVLYSAVHFINFAYTEVLKFDVIHILEFVAPFPSCNTHSLAALFPSPALKSLPCKDLGKEKPKKDKHYF